MLDITKIFDPVKIRFYQEWLYANHHYFKGNSFFQQELTLEAVKTNIDPLNLHIDSRILDLSCGPGYFLDLMKERGFTNVTGITLNDDEASLCAEKGHVVHKYDFSFLPQNKGYHDESTDFIFLRNALTSSPFPIFSLIEFNRVLKQHSKMYIEVSAPDCGLRHEWNLNCYSILGPEQLSALLMRTGFNIDYFRLVEYDIDIKEDDTTKNIKEKHFSILVTKVKPLDIK